jgi:hypothetical protein
MSLLSAMVDIQRVDDEDIVPPNPISRSMRHLRVIFNAKGDKDYRERREHFE